jgi:hypothetical protein
MAKYRVGDRVEDEYLGLGTIEQLDCAGLRGFHLVRFDTTPPVRFNMGENPTAVFEDRFRKVSSPQ